MASREVAGGLATPVGYDPFAPEVIADPYPWYERLRRGAPLHRTERHDVWVLSRYDDVRAACRNHKALSSAEGVAYQRIGPPMMLTLDPPDHTRLRRFVARDFTPTAVRRWRPIVESLVGHAIDRMLVEDVTDFVEVLAGPLPVKVIAEVLGVSPGDYPDFKRWSDDIVEGFKLGDDPQADDASVVRIAGGLSGLQAYVQSGVAERRTSPRDDLVTQLLQPRDGEALTDFELFWFFLLLLVAGNETTTNLLGNLTLALLEHPDQWRVLRDSPALIPSAVEEALRYDSPIQGFFRTALAPYRVGDDEIPEGGRVLLLFGAANRDDTRYPRAQAFDVSRNPVDHLAFGSGIHLCLGAHLARLEGSMVLDQLCTRVRRMEPAGEVVRTSNPTLRGVARLPLQVAPA